MEELIFFSAKKQAELIREGKISSQELVQAHIQQVEKVNPKINALVQFYPEKALENAKKADEALARNQKIGLLHGVPFTVKDIFEVKNSIITAGTLGLKENRCTENATAVNRLLEAGGVLLGISNCPEIALSFETDNYIYGRTNNPYDLERTPGGSSGGEAAIIAAGGSPLGLGSDFAGSLRLPAHFCGIAAIRPTSGRISCAGHYFYSAIRAFFIAVGPMSRYVEDLIYTLPILSGVDSRDPLTQPVPLRAVENIKLEELRVAYFMDNKIMSPAADTIAVMQNAINLLSKIAKKINAYLPKAAEQSYNLLKSFFEYGGSDLVVQRLNKLGTEQIHPLVKGFIQQYRKGSYSAVQIADLFEAWFKYKVEMMESMENYDVLISPVNAFPAMKHGASLEEANAKGFSYTMTHSLTGWPSVVVRCGTSHEGLPIGLQITAKPWREDIALAVAAYLEKNLGGWSRAICSSPR